MAAAQPSSRHALALPPTLSPDDLDTLSELSTVLAKVRAGIQSSSGLTAPGGGGTGTTPGANNHNNNSGGGGSGAGGHSGAASAGTGSGGGGGNDAGAGNAQQLSFKDVPGATDGIKHKLQHARAQIRALPDMDRSIDDQQREIAELEARIDRQRQLLERLRERGVQFGKENGAGGEDVKMEM